MKIFSIGSCRIQNPIKSILSDKIEYPPCECKKFCTGFVHTHSTNEIIQYIRYLKNEIELPDELNHLVIHNKIKCKSQTNYVKDNFKNAEVVIIEISSVKNIIIDGKYYVNIMKYNHNINDTPKIRKRKVIKKETPDEVIANLHTISSLLGDKKLMLQSHMNIPLDDGSINKPRNELIQAVLKYGKDNNVKVFDPTVFVNELGVKGATLEGKLTEFSAEMIEKVKDYYRGQLS